MRAIFMGDVGGKTPDGEGTDGEGTDGETPGERIDLIGIPIASFGVCRFAHRETRRSIESWLGSGRRRETALAAPYR